MKKRQRNSMIKKVGEHFKCQGNLKENLNLLECLVVENVTFDMRVWHLEYHWYCCLTTWGYLITTLVYVIPPSATLYLIL